MPDFVVEQTKRRVEIAALKANQLLIRAPNARSEED